MGFDQYHEPPDELPAATRTFARLCASLTEEAEAIGWYEQRLAVETDPEAVAIMRDAQGEEFKHFSMDLEFLLRRTPRWREIAQGILFQPGDIVEHGEAAEAEALRRRRRRRRAAAFDDGSLGIGGLRGAATMNHLLRGTRADQRRRLGAARRGGARAAQPGARGAQARRLLGPARLGALGHQPRPRRAGRPRRRARASAACSGGCCRWSSCAPTSSSSRAELRDADRGADDADLEALDEAAHQIAVAENVAVFHGWDGARSPASREASPHERPSARRGRRRATRARSPRAVERLLRSGIAGPVRARARPRAVPTRGRDRRARRLPAARPPAQDPRAARSSGRRASRARSWCSLRGGDFLFESGQDLSIGYDSHDGDVVRLYLEESFSFHVATPEAAVVLTG